MKPRLTICTIILSAMIMTAFLTMSYVTIANAERVSSLGRSDFPARVKAIGFPSGNEISPSSSLTWGKWSVSFKGQLPIAKYSYVPDLPQYVIEGLRCSNSVVGTTNCALTGTMNREVCMLNPGGGASVPH